MAAPHRSAIPTMDRTAQAAPAASHPTRAWAIALRVVGQSCTRVRTTKKAQAATSTPPARRAAVTQTFLRSNPVMVGAASSMEVGGHWLR